MRLIDADRFDKRIRAAGGICEEELTEDFKDGVLTVLDMLKAEPTVDVTDTNVGDTISRQAAIEAIENALGVDGFRDGLLTRHSAKSAIRSVPSAERTGHWIIRHDSTGATYGECSKCGMKQYAGHTNYCPYCGAHMEGGENA